MDEPQPQAAGSASAEQLAALLDVEVYVLSDQQVEDVIEELNASLAAVEVGNLPGYLRFRSDDLIRHFEGAAAAILKDRLNRPLTVPVEVEELLTRMVSECGLPEEPEALMTVTLQQYLDVTSYSLPSPLNSVTPAVPRIVPGSAVGRSEDRVLLLPRSHTAG